MHTIQLADRNQCANAFDFEIVSLNAPIEIHADISDVKCFDGSDGRIIVSITGGVAPFTYAWSGKTGGTPELSNVGPGEYQLTVTDKAGCKRVDKYSVSQPGQPLHISVTTVPVCYGMTNGSITIASSGGTQPYQYSIDDGDTYQHGEIFNAVGIGTYAIRVKDDHECLATAHTQIVQRNDRPEPDFVVATQESALDTLVVTEISVPKPDSVQWMFDARTVILDNDVWHPKIKFEEAGNYSLGMKGYFGGCVYTVTRALIIDPYDPESVKTTSQDYKAVQSVDVSPNPNTGQFTVTIKLNYKHSLSMAVYDVLGGVRYQNAWNDVDGATETINMNDVAAGIYLLRVVTPLDTKDVRIVINP